MSALELTGSRAPQSRTTGIRILIVVALLSVFCGHAQTFGKQSDAAKPDKSAKMTAEATAFNVQAAQQFGQKLSVAEWLGPLAPVALSPFFGITCLAGMALFGGNFISTDNAFLGENSPLHNPTLFWVFLGLTILTSLPRLTKVSKPFAQAVDQLEAWAGVGTLMIIKWLTAGGGENAEVALVHAGIFDVGVDTLLMIAGAVNVIVINAVKFFFEVLIWITPIPFLDAVFEAANKSTCAALMALYGYSPFAATVVNLILFAVCLLVFGWVRRREIFFRTMLLDSVKAWWKGKSVQPKSELVVFPAQAFGPFRARAKCRLSTTENGWQLKQRRLLRAPLIMQLSSDANPEIEQGFFTNTLHLNGAEPATCSFSRLYNSCLPELASHLQLQNRAAGENSQGALRAEFA